MTELYSFTVWKAGSPNSKCLQGWLSPEGSEGDSVLSLSLLLGTTQQYWEVNPLRD